MTERPLAVSLGDPAGVGPELIAAAWARRGELALPPFVVCGGAGVLRAAGARRGLDVPTVVVGDPAEAVAAFANAVPVYGEDDVPYLPGVPDIRGAQVALASLTRAADLVATGQAAAMTTGPVSKAQLGRAGFKHPGQTEFVAAASGIATHKAVMMLAGPKLRTVPVTIHCSLRDAINFLTPEQIVRTTWTVAQALKRDFGISVPRIAMAGLNPHAGEGGLFGNEEETIIRPALDRLKQHGVIVDGPHPPDTLFTPRTRETYDVAICMYHDQALIPLKALDFDEGVNVTLGLPIVRTSPDHGTAFAIAGTGTAHPGATIAAIRMAAQMAARRAQS